MPWVLLLSLPRWQRSSRPSHPRRQAAHRRAPLRQHPGAYPRARRQSSQPWSRCSPSGPRPRGSRCQPRSGAARSHEGSFREAHMTASSASQAPGRENRREMTLLPRRACGCRHWLPKLRRKPLPCRHRQRPYPRFQGLRYPLRRTYRSPSRLPSSMSILAS